MEIDFNPIDHSYTINGRAVPSVTQVLQPLNDWSHVSAVELECARALGSDVHEACALLVRGSLDWHSLDSALVPYVRAAERFLNESGLTVIACEQAVGSKVLGVAGTLDILAHWRGYECFIDWKLSESVPSTVGAQCAAYEKLYAETFRRKSVKRVRSKRICVRLRKNDYRVDVLPDFNVDYALFISCLNTYKHRQRKWLTTPIIAP